MILVHFLLLLQPCYKLSIVEEVNTREFIAIGIIDEEHDAGGSDPNYTFKIIDYFKGYGNLRTVLYAPDFEFENNTYYLIFGAGKGLNSHFIERCSYTNKLSLIDTSTLNYLYENLGTVPCYDERKRKENGEGACERIYNLVCGCNGETYGNSCEAIKNGVMKYLSGECK